MAMGKISTNFYNDSGIRFRDFDGPLKIEFNHEMDQQFRKLREIEDRLHTLETKARFRIELLEEDNSKAIFVFTFVTAVFLPLSFITSYLGMNTADIRDMSNSQATFWIMAVPVTIAVVSVAMFVAYKGDTVREYFSGHRHNFRLRGQRRKNISPKRDAGERLPQKLSV